MAANQYSKLAGVGTGWDWLTLIGYGDFMNFLGIAFLWVDPRVLSARLTVLVAT